MTANATVYVLNPQPLSQAMLEEIIQHAEKSNVSKVGNSFVVRWEKHEFTITINLMPKEDIPKHLQGFLGFAQQFGASSAMLERIKKTQQAFGMVIDPGFESFGYCRSVVLGLAKALDGIFFVVRGVYDQDGQLQFQMGGMPPVFFPEYPSETELSLGRKQRSISRLQQEGISYIDHLPVIDDEQSMTIRSKELVCQRALALYAVAALAFGIERDRFDKFVKEYNLQAAFTPNEQKFIQNPVAREQSAFTWRIEGFWALVWALGFIEKLEWPDSECNTERAVEIIDTYDTTEKFLKQAKLRSTTEILDALDLTYRYHWAVRNAYVKEQQPETNLHPGVVYERHYALNWLISYLGFDWDDVQTNT